MTSEESTPSEEATPSEDSTPVTTDQPRPPGSNVADLVDEMEDRVLHGEPEEAQEEKEQTDSSEETPEPKDVDPSGGAPV